MGIGADVCRQCRGNQDTVKLLDQDAVQILPFDAETMDKMPYDIWNCTFCNQEYRALRGGVVSTAAVPKLAGPKPLPPSPPVIP